MKKNQPDESEAKKVQEIRDQISSEIKDLTSEQLKEYADDKLKEKEIEPE